MPIRVSDIHADRRETSFKYTIDGNEEVVNLTYRPSAFTSRAQDTMQDAFDKTRFNGMIAVLVGIPEDPGGDGANGTIAQPAMLVAWDVMGEDGAPLPITYENLQRLPVDFINALYGAMNSDSSPNPTRRGSSSATQKRAAS